MSRDDSHRVAGVRQTAMAATGLPLELQQQIFHHLDPKSFYHARRVCRHWLFASTDAVPLARQLRHLPVLPSVDLAHAGSAELQDLYEEAARRLMLGVRAERVSDRPGSLTRAARLGFPVHPRVCATACGSRTVALDGRNIALFDTSGPAPVCLAQRPINDLKEAVGSGPWLRIHPHAYHELALSSDGRLLAMAQERTIQIYDLLADPDSFTVNQYVSSASGHYICGLDFEQDDHLLRVRLSGKGAVLYLGTPPRQEQADRPASLEHWKSRAGLRHTCLDSSLLAIPEPTEEGEPPPRIAGLQLLQPFEDGFLFAGQRHGGDMASHYILGHVQLSTPHHTGALPAAPTSVTILARLESFLSSWSLFPDSGSAGGLGTWENMPSAHEHHPRFALDTHHDYLALAERDKKRIRAAPLCQLFLYRVPSASRMRQQLLRPAHRIPRHDQTSSSSSPVSKYSVPRTPLCLSTIPGDITRLTLDSTDDTSCSVSAATADTTRTWLLRDV